MLYVRSLVCIVSMLAACMPFASLPTPGDIVVRNAYVLAGPGWAEATVAAVAPGENASCKDGRLFIASQNWAMATKLDGTLETLGVNAVDNPYKFPFNETFDPVLPLPSGFVHPYIIFDNHIVKLPKGVLIASFEGVTWDQAIFPKPSWWNLTNQKPLKDQKYPGGRGIIKIFRSIDCGQSWTPATDIDAATLPVRDESNKQVSGLCGYPRLTADSFHYEAGGWDGHYLYGDPYNGSLYLTTMCAYGNLDGNESRIGLVLRSDDQGNTWTMARELFGTSLWRVPVVAGPAARPALSYALGNDWFFTLITPSPPGAPTLVDKLALDPRTQDQQKKACVNTNMLGYPSLSGDVGSNFKVSMPKWVGARLGLPIYTVDDHGANPKSLLVVMGSGADSDVLWGTFIPGIPGDPVDALVWTEPTPDATLCSRFRVKYQVFNSNQPLLASPGELTLKGKNPYSYPYSKDVFVGDYVGGSSYVGTDGSRNFVTVWNEDTGLHFNTITVKPGAAAKIKGNVTVNPGNVPPNTQLRSGPSLRETGHAPVPVVREPAP